MNIETALLSAFLSAFVALATTWLTLRYSREKLRREFQLEYATEAALRKLLESDDYEMRAFDKIRHHLPGFRDDNELRLYLIRAGAVRFQSQELGEVWGLLDRHYGKAFK